jgi:hypothetical protein
VVDCAVTVQGQACSLPARSPYFPLRRENGSIIGRATGDTWRLGRWGVRASCQSSKLTVEVARFDRSGNVAADPLNQGKNFGWQPLFPDGSLGLGCADALNPAATPSCVGPSVGTDDFKLCSRLVYCEVTNQGGTFGCFAPCQADEMPYACGFVAAAAYTVGQTYAQPTTSGGLPGCECNIGAIDHCTGGTEPWRGCRSSCFGTCTKVVKSH